jgi:hypothetical protein
MLKKVGAPVKIEAIGNLKPGTEIRKTASPEETRKTIVSNIEFKHPKKKESNDCA